MRNSIQFAEDNKLMENGKYEWEVKRLEWGLT